MATELDREQIKARIPHREPFLFLDRVTDLIEGQSCVAWMDNPQAVMDRLRIQWWRGFPRPMLAEMAAETLGVIGGLPEGRIGLLTGLDQWKFHRRRMKGPISLYVIMGRLRSNAGRGFGEARVNKKLLGKGRISFGMVDLSQLSA